ncbi:TRIP13 [Cordylochernes scorpioides]|uniref:TRIP13 n=1 Tax=Cordylochernes scorpioides TaxID=51811 RepID=A0ABY6KPZ3_9ARAC|nr:TRIP13 [Cordylochernes scorpioides]
MVFGDLILSEFHTPELRDHVEQVAVCDLELGDPSAPLLWYKCELWCQQRVSQGVDLRQARLELHVYREHHDGPGCEDLGEEEEITAATHWLLPSQDFHGLWDSLVMDSEIKSQLLNFVSTSLLFSDKKVNSNLVSWNGVVLLHGPPGTGKTSLCKALAHKLTVRFSNRYLYGQLIEINSHSLFSKWFSEVGQLAVHMVQATIIMSGKLVLKMFQKIQEYIDDPKSLVFVLIDEVESLAHTRTASMGGTEPSDAIRVVNALLTQIDQIRRFPNVIILTTSNVTGAIDLAFVDRADIKQYIGPPSVAAIYQIYFTAIQELLKVGIVAPKESLLPLRQLSLASCVENNHHNAFLRCSLRLMEVAK